MAERVGFEPTVRENRTPDFESGSFDHSDTSPRISYTNKRSALYAFCCEFRLFGRKTDGNIDCRSSLVFKL